MYDLKEQLNTYMHSHRDELTADISVLCSIDSSKQEAAENAPYGKGAAKALSIAAKLMENYGLKTRNYGGYIVTGDLLEDDKTFDIIGHVDVVKAGDGWTVTAPFEPKLIDGKLYARGASDNKGPTVAAIYAVRAVKELGIPVSKNVRLIIGTDEETDFNDIKDYYKQEAEAKYTIAPDLKFPVTNTEKGQFRGELTASYNEESCGRELVSFDGGIATNIVPAYAYALIRGITASEAEAAAVAAGKNGCTVKFKVSEESPESSTKAEANADKYTENILTEDDGAEKLTVGKITEVCAEKKCAEEISLIKIEAFGTGSHCANIESGDNAVTALLELVSSLKLDRNEAFEKLCTLSSLFPYSDLYGKTLGVDLVDNETCRTTLSLDIVRINKTSAYAKFDSRTALAASFENTIDAIRRQVEATGFSFGYEFDEPHHVPESDPLVQKLLDIYSDYTGEEAHCTSIGISSYAHFTKNGVAFGAEPPALNTNMHGPDEFVYIDDMEKTAVMIALAIAELCR